MDHESGNTRGAYYDQSVEINQAGFFTPAFLFVIKECSRLRQNYFAHVAVCSPEVTIHVLDHEGFKKGRIEIRPVSIPNLTKKSYERALG